MMRPAHVHVSECLRQIELLWSPPDKKERPRLRDEAESENEIDRQADYTAPDKSKGAA